ncbi:MAG: hypothetical protein ACRER7_07970 [Gammaproteobacteria bacterium]
MQLRIVNLSLLMVFTLACASAWADNGLPPQKPPAPDVTITVIPAGQDVLNTVVQNISVPAHAAAQKPGTKPAAGGTRSAASQFGQQTAQSAKQIEESKEAWQAEQHEAENAARQAQQQAQAAAENQSQQARQAQQQAQSLSHQQPNPPPHPPPPPPPGPPGG